MDYAPLVMVAVIGGIVSLVGKIIFDWLKHRGEKSNGRDANYELLIQFESQMESQSNSLKRIADSSEKLHESIAVLSERLNNLPENISNAIIARGWRGH